MTTFHSKATSIALIAGLALAVATGGATGFIEYQHSQPLYQLRPKLASALIVNSPGGNVKNFLEVLARFKKDGTKVRISGACYSACTLFTALPKDQVCVTASSPARGLLGLGKTDTQLGFHKPYYPLLQGMRAYSKETTDDLFNHYPKRIKDWIQSKGGLKSDLIILKGKELFELIPRCK